MTADPSSREANRALAVVSLAVFLAASPWFSGTAAMASLRRVWALSEAAGAWLTIAVQLGFIVGTFLYAVLNVSDIFSARWVFFGSAVAAAAFNAAFAAWATGLASAIAFRFLTGVALAGVYPVAMKIVASWFRTGLGWRLGVMVGALTLGTASSYLMQAVGRGVDWRLLVGSASAAAVLGGLLIVVAVDDGPHLRSSARFDPRMVLKVFGHRPFRYSAFGYFGHMWELYALWSQVSLYLAASLGSRGFERAEVLPLVAFLTVALGAFGCVAGGWVSRRAGERAVALVSLVISGCLCALSGWAFALPPAALVAYLLVWGVFVVSDSPQFSALAARYCPPEYTGTALTVQNGVGFAVTTISIQLVPVVAGIVGWRWAFVFLTAGPAVGAYFIARLGSVARNPIVAGAKMTATKDHT